MEIFTLFEGNFWATVEKPLIKIKIENQPKPLEKSLKISIQPFLIKLNSQFILCDTGLGQKNEQGLPEIIHNINKYGVSAKDINIILISHLHKDHCSGLLNIEGGKIVSNFPNAKIFIRKAEYDYALYSNKKSYSVEFIKQLESINSQIEWVKELDFYINENIFVSQSGGHCPYHQVFRIFNNDQILFFGGDELATKTFLNYKLKASFDFDPELALQLRNKWIKQGRNENWRFLLYHDVD